jgi:hypothetical protein
MFGIYIKGICIFQDALSCKFAAIFNSLLILMISVTLLPT